MSPASDSPPDTGSVSSSLLPPDDGPPDTGGGNANSYSSLGFMDKLKLLAKTYGAAQQQLTPWGTIQRGIDAAGEKTAEGLGSVGLPKTGAAIGTGIQMIPDAAAAVGFASPALSGTSRMQEILNAGPRIGAAEKAAGIITQAADRYPTSGNVGEYLNTLESQFSNGTITDPSTARTAKDITDYIQQNPNLVGKSKAITVQAARVSKLASDTLNQLVPGRAEAADDFATLMKYMGPAKALSKIAAGGVLSSAGLYGMAKIWKLATGQ